MLAVNVGAVTGGNGSSSGAIVSAKGVGAITINGDLTGGDGYTSGGIAASGGSVPSINVKGAIITGSYYNGIYVHGTLGSLTAGSMQGSILFSGYVEVLGKLDDAGAGLPSVAIGRILVKGDATGWAFIAGLDENVGGSNPYASIGSITVNGTAENMAVLAGTDYSLSADPSDDVHISGGSLPNAVASIANIVVKGATTNCFFEAQQIKSASLEGTVAPVTSGKLNDANLSIATGNILREL